MDLHKETECSRDQPSYISSPPDSQEQFNPSGPGSIPLIDDTNIDESDDDGVLQITSVFSLASDEQQTELPTGNATELASKPEEYPEPEVTQLPEVTSDGPFVSRLSIKGDNEASTKLTVTRTYIAKPDSGSVRYVPNYNKEESGLQSGVQSASVVGKERYILPKVSEDSVSTPPNSVSGNDEITRNTNTSPVAAVSPVVNTTALRSANTVISTISPVAAKTGSETKLSAMSPEAPVATLALRAEPLQGGTAVRLHPVANVKNANGQIVQVPITTISRPSTVSTPSEALASSVGSIVRLVNGLPKITAAAAPVVTPNKVIATQAPSSLKTIVTKPAAQPLVTKLAAQPIATKPALQQLVTVQQGTNIVTSTPKLVLVKKPGALPSDPGQLMYIVDSTNPATGKPVRFIIPESSVTNQNLSLYIPPSPTATPQVTQIQNIVTKSPVVSPTSQNVQMFLKPAATANPVKLPPPFSTYLKTGDAFVKSPATSTSTKQTLYFVKRDASTMAKPEAIEAASPTSSPLQASQNEDASTSSLEPGVSPHEARIRKLKELLKQQEQAVDKMREKRRKELDNIRESCSVKADSSSRKTDSSSPFLVPLPPKRARTAKTNQQGFLPSDEDTNFVKLVGLEKVVQKIKDNKQQAG